MYHSPYKIYSHILNTDKPRKEQSKISSTGQTELQDKHVFGKQQRKENKTKIQLLQR